MNRNLFVLFFTFLITLCANAQQTDPVIFKIDGEPIHKSEVERAYLKGNELNNTDNKQSPKEFVQSYIDYKLNIKEAKAQLLDTTAAYRRDLLSHRSEIGASYMIDTVFENDYVKKIYKRTLENIELNHIIVPFENQVVLPSDTVVAYNKAMELRTKILKDGFDFKKLNLKETLRPLSTSVEDKNGYVGWIAPFMLSTNVEDVAYSIPILEVSMPIRSQKGYHIIQVLSKRPSMGSVEIEQVVFMFTKIPATQQQIDSVGAVAQREYKLAQSTNDFQPLCDAFSRVYKTGDKGCYYGVIGLDAKLPTNFINAAFNLKNIGDVSEPVKSDYGFHIIKLIGKKAPLEFDDVKEELRSKIIQSDKVQNLSIEKKNRLLSNFKININQEAYAKLADITATLSPLDSAFLQQIKNPDELLFDIDGKTGYTVNEFAKYIHSRQKEYEGDKDELAIIRITSATNYTLSTDILKNFFDSFISILVSSYAEDTLEDRYPEFRRMMDEFSDGLLAYDVENRNIWKRSVTDNIGLSEYYNKNKSKYKLDTTRYKGIIIYSKNEEALKKAEQLSEKVKNREELIQEIKSEINNETILVQTESGLWKKGENPFVDYKIFGGDKPSPKVSYPYFSVMGKFIDKPEDYIDVRNLVELDYQKSLEAEWKKYLRSKYKVEIDKSALNTIK